MIMITIKGRDRDPGRATCVINTVLYVLFIDIFYKSLRGMLKEHNISYK
jgi:hypothetical protein